MGYLGKRIYLFTILSSLVFAQGCFVYKSGPAKTTVRTEKKFSDPINSNVTAVSVVGNKLIISGTGFANATNVDVQGTSFSEHFSISTLTDTRIEAMTTRSVNIALDQALSLIISNADAQVTFPITFTLQDGAVTANKLNSMGASIGQILKFNGTSWTPATLSNSQVFLGTWNAVTNFPNIDPPGAFQNGDYLIVSHAGRYNSVDFNTGDWVMFNGTSWDRIDNSSNTVNSFNGRKGPVVPMAGDYGWSLISKSGSKLQDIADVDVTSIGNGDVLLWNATTSKWVSSTFSSTPPAGSVGSSQLADGSVSYIKLNLADGSIPQAKISGLVSDLAAKQSTIIAGTTGQFFRGDKTWATLDTSVVPENGNFYFTNSRAINALKGADFLGIATITGIASPINPTDIANMNYVTTYVSSALSGYATTASLSNYATTAALAATNTNVTNITSALLTTDTTATNLATTVAGKADKAGANFTGNIQLNAQKEVRFADADSSNYVSLKSPAIVAANVTFTLPSSAGGAGQILSSDGNASAPTLSWVTPYTLTDGSVTTDKIADGAVTYDKIDDTGASVGQFLMFDGLSWQPTSITDPQIYLGTWDGTTSVPTLAVSGGYYIVSVAGSGYSVGDWIISNGSAWQRIANFTNPVMSSITPTGDFSLIQNSVAPFTSIGAGATANTLYLKAGRVGIGKSNPGATLDIKGPIRLSGSSSGYVGFQPAADAGSTVWTLPAVDGSSNQVLTTNGTGILSWSTPAGGVTSVNSATGAVTLTSSNIAEGSNLYYTNARGIASTITAPTLTNTAIATGDTLQVVAGKLQAQVSSKEGALTNSAGLAAALSNETGTGFAVFSAAPTISNPVITNIAPAADFTLTQNSVAVITSVNASATASTLYLSAGKVGIGAASTTEKLEVSGNIKAQGFYYSSDRRLKEDFRELESPLDTVLNLHGVNFRWRNNQTRDVGFIAQEVEKVVPDVVATSKATGLKSVKYGNLVALLVEAIKNLYLKVEAKFREHDKRLAILEEENKKLIDERNTQQGQIDRQQRQLDHQQEQIDQLLKLNSLAPNERVPASVR